MIFAQPINKKYIVEEKISGGSKFVGEYNLVEYSIKSDDDKLLYKITNKTDYDIPYSDIEVFDNGCSVLISAFHGTLTFFNNNGAKLKEIKLHEDIDVEYERSIKSVVDANSLLMSYKDLANGISVLHKYNSNGILEIKIKIEKTNINGLAYSVSLNQIYISSIEWNNDGGMKKVISLINEDGELLTSYSANFEKGFFTEKNKFIAFSNKSLISINAENLVLNFQNKPTHDELYIDVTSLKDSIIVVTAETPKLQNGKWIYKNPTIVKMDLSGNIIDKNEVETSSFSEFGFRKTSKALLFTVGYKSITIE